jgi:hypothetical protein
VGETATCRPRRSPRLVGPAGLGPNFRPPFELPSRAPSPAPCWRRPHPPLTPGDTLGTCRLRGQVPKGVGPDPVPSTAAEAVRAGRRRAWDPSFGVKPEGKSRKGPRTEIIDKHLHLPEVAEARPKGPLSLLSRFADDLDTRVAPVSHLLKSRKRPEGLLRHLGCLPSVVPDDRLRLR